MEKTISITLGGYIFNIEEAAYKKLDDYLKSIKNHYEFKESEDILADIESSIAEKFSNKINQKKKIITDKDVDEIIRIMGRVNEFADEETAEENLNAESKKTEAPSAKKLYRNPDDVVIAGVASGIAAYFGIDPVFVRLVFVILALTKGFGVMAYLILWIIMPKAKTNSQRLEMQGQPVNLKKLEEAIKEKSGKIREDIRRSGKNNLKKIIAFPFKILEQTIVLIKKIIRSLWPIISFLLGFLLVISSIIGVLAISFAAGALIMQIDSPYLISDIPLKEFAHSTSYYLAVASLYFIFLIPIFFVLIFGVTLIKRENSFRLIASSLMISIWMVSLVSFGLVSLDLFPQIKTRMEEITQAETTSRSYDFKNIDSLRLGLNGQIKIIKGDEFKFNITAEEKVLDQLLVETEGSELKITQPIWRQGICIFCFDKPLVIEAVLPELKSFIAFRNLNAELNGFDNQEIRVNSGEAAKVKLNLTGGNLNSYIAGTSGRIELTGSPDTVNAVLEGAGSFIASDISAEEIDLNQSVFSRATLSGNTKKLTATLGGASRLYANEMIAEEAAIKTSGQARAEIYVKKALKALAESFSRIYYRGQPEELNEETSEGGKIINISDF